MTTTKSFHLASNSKAASIGCSNKANDEKYTKTAQKRQIDKILVEFSRFFVLNFVSHLSVFWTMIDKHERIIFLLCWYENLIKFAHEFQSTLKHSSLIFDWRNKKVSRVGESQVT